jgi:hypothetical protein
MTLDPHRLIEVALGLAGLVLWFLAFGGAWLLTRPADVRPGPPTQDFGGPEPPAVVSLLVNRWELTEDAAESTLIDLAARRILEFRQPGNDPQQTTVHVRQSNPGGLTRYEQAIFGRVTGLAVNGVVPLTALTFRDKDQAARFAKKLNQAIVADARERGLSRRRFSPAVVSTLGVLAAIPAGAIGGAVALDLLRRHKLGDDGMGALFAVLFTWGVLAGLAAKVTGERDTPEGRTVAARWLGLRAYLRGDESFADLPPSAVTVWDRYLSYGDAVGATRVCSAVIDLGMGNRKRVWSSFGGTWHRVKVRYPAFWPRYGQKTVRLVIKAVVALVLSALLYRGSSVLPHTLDALGLVFAVVFLLPLFYGVYTLVAAVIDAATPRRITGEALWVEVWKSNSGGEDSPPVPWLHHLAIDDGTADRTVAWGCPSNLADRVSAGDIVEVTVRRWTRRVVELRVTQEGRQRALQVSTIDTGEIITGGGTAAVALATALRAPEVAPAQLVTLDEVSRALGQPVVAQGLAGAALGPMSVEQYRAAHGGQRLLVLNVATGPAGDLAMRMRRRASAVPGIGDEAYAGESWAAARRGRHVVMLQLHGDAKRVDPRNVYWLLSVAVSRMR